MSDYKEIPASYVPPEDLGTYSELLRQHHEDDWYNDPKLAHLRENILQMRDAVKDTFGDGPVVISGEQSVFPLGKNVMKPIVVKGLQVIHNRIIGVNLRANHDLAGSERPIYGVTIPDTNAQNGEFAVNVLSGKWRKSPLDQLATSGVPLNSEVKKSIFDAFSPARIRKIYGSKRSDGLDELNRPVYVDSYDEQVVADFLACYGIGLNGESLTELPENLQILAADNPNRVGNAEQMGITLPVTLDQGHENAFLMLQKKLGIDLEHTVSEGYIDRMLLMNGGVEVLQKIWKESVRKIKDLVDQGHLSADELASIKMRPGYEEESFFNITFEGYRMEARFSQDDDSLLEIYDPRGVTKTTDGEGKTVKSYPDPVRKTVMEVVSNPTYNISLKAVPRVLLYSMAGLAGHVTGGGSAYNRDAQLVAEYALGIPYFPIISMSKVDAYGRPTSPVQYVSTALPYLNMSPNEITGQHVEYDARRYPLLNELLLSSAGNAIKSDRLNNQLAIMAKLQAGEYGMVIDPLMSLDEQTAKNEIGEFVGRGSDIKRTDRIVLTNRSGIRPKI